MAMVVGASGFLLFLVVIFEVCRESGRCCRVVAPFGKRGDGLLTRHIRRVRASGCRRSALGHDRPGSRVPLWQCEGHRGRVQSRALGRATDTTRHITDGPLLPDSGVKAPRTVGAPFTGGVFFFFLRSRDLWLR